MPNNAQLELKKINAGPRQFDNVIISLQLEDGARLEPQSFKPDTATLLNVIEAYRKSYSSQNVESMLQEALEENVSNDIYPTFSYLNEQVIGLYQIKNTTLKDLGVTNGRVIVRFNMRKMSKEEIENLNAQFDQKLKKKEKLDQVFESKLKENQETRAQQNSTEVISSVNNTETQPEKRPKFNEMKEYDIINRNETREALTTTTTTTAIERIIVQDNQFANFKFPEETRGQNLNEMNELAEIERMSKQPCDRKTILLHLDNKKPDQADQTSVSSNVVDEEEFYKVTVDDLRFMLSDLRKTQTEDAPLMTRQMRELEQDKKAMRYTYIVIRIVFKNRQTLQGLFRPKESVSVLYDFVRESLLSVQSGHNTEEDLDFYLFTTPPKVLLSDMKKTLFECQLCPAAMVYFKNKNDTVPKLRPELLDDVKTVDEADELVHTHVHQQIRNVEHEGMNWLQKEQALKQNLLKSTGLSKLTATGQKSSTSSVAGAASGANSSTARGSNSDIDSEVNRRLERFLKGKK